MADIVDQAQDYLERCYQQGFTQTTFTKEAIITDRYCRDCGLKIPQARVEAIPHCRRCIHCQEIAER